VNNYTTEKKHNLAKDASKAFLWNHGLYVINSVLLGITTYILARFLEPAGYGVFAAIMAFGSVLALIVSFGFEGALNIHLPRLRSNKPALRFLVRQMFIRRLIIIAVLFLFLLLMALSFEDLWLPNSIKKLHNYLYLAVICGLISLISGLVTRVLITLFRIKYFAGIRITYITLNLILYFIILKNGFGIKEILWITVVTSLIAVILYVYACRDLLFGPTNKFSLNRIHRLGFTIWSSDLLGYLLGKNLDIIIMSLYGVSAKHIGFYQITFLLVAYTRMIVTKGMTGVLQSAFSSAYKEGGLESLKKWWMITMKFQILAVSPGVLFLVLFSRQIFESFLPQYREATLLMQTYGSLAFIITILGGGTHITAFYAAGKEKIVLFTRILAGILNLILDIILIYSFGVLGALIATGISVIVVCSLELYLVYFHLGTNYPTAFLIKSFICLSLAGFVASRFSGSNILNLVMYGFIYFFVYLISAWLIKPLDKEDIIRISAVNSRLSLFLTPFSAKSKMVSTESL
jgi:O-antigen/teichoic acid export membrane protein